MYLINMDAKIVPHSNLRRLAMFSLVGILGFIVESSTIASLILYAQISPISAKFIGFPIAVLVTWILNRRLTFRSEGSGQIISETLKYFQITIGGMGVNVLAFFAVLTINPNSLVIVWFATASGALAGMLVNYLGCNRFVFPKKKAGIN